MPKYFLLLCVIFTSCTFETPTKFSKEALNDSLINLQNDTFSFDEIISQNKGKKIFINLWASWCADCIKGFPKIKELQKSHQEVVFLFISVDENNAAWKNAINKFNIIGEHYNLPKGMKKGALVDFLNLRWIPRYLVIDEQGSISLFKATKITDSSIYEALKTNL